MKAQNDKGLRFFARKAHSNDNAEFLLCASNAFCRGYALLLQRAKKKGVQIRILKAFFVERFMRV